MKRNQVTVRDRSGSCAVILLVTPSKVFCANVGDSRAVLSGDEGSRVFALSRDHKPLDEFEERKQLQEAIRR